MAHVNGVELFLLGRLLMKIGEEAMPAPKDDGKPLAGSTRVVLIVLSDIVEHEDTAVGEIAARTGLPQSQVSAAVARLRTTGSVETRQDPGDRRRVLIRPASTTSTRVAQVRGTTVDAAVATALGTDDQEQLGEVLAALHLLAGRLHPRGGRPGAA